jgi:hypothetical protein
MSVVSTTLISAPNLSPLFRTLSQSNTTALQRLILSSNGLQDDNLVRLANYLRCTTHSVSSAPCSLVYLDLSYNGICSGYGMTEFCNSLAVNTSIQTLLLAYNYLNVDTLLTLAFNLQGGSTLRNLHLEGNDAFSSNRGAKALVPAVQCGLYRIVTSRPDPPWSNLYDNHLRWYTHLNWAGRHLVQGNNYPYCRKSSNDDDDDDDAQSDDYVARAGGGPVSIPIGLWPFILARINQNCDGRYHDRQNIHSVMYFLLNRGPVLLERPSAFAVLEEPHTI